MVSRTSWLGNSSLSGSCLLKFAFLRRTFRGRSLVLFDLSAVGTRSRILPLVVACEGNGGSERVTGTEGAEGRLKDALLPAIRGSPDGRTASPSDMDLEDFEIGIPVD